MVTLKTVLFIIFWSLFMTLGGYSIGYMTGYDIGFKNGLFYNE